MSLEVAQTIATVQGESSRAGYTCWLIRLAGCELRMARRQINRAGSMANLRMRGEKFARPFIVGAIAHDKLEGVVRLQDFEVFRQVARALTGFRCLDVDNATNARINIGNVNCTARLE